MVWNQAECNSKQCSVANYCYFSAYRYGWTCCDVWPEFKWTFVSLDTKLL